ncbi:MAG TPA: hypothetical protein VF637_11015 [Sphingomicrobium sp.]|jgi:hypothetical protein
MGNLVSLELYGPDHQAHDEGGAVVLELSAKNALPLFWLSLLSEENTTGEWERMIRDHFAAPDDVDDDPTPIRIDWQSAQTMLDRAEARVDQRAPAFSKLFHDWASALRTIGDEGSTQEVSLELTSYANFFDGVGAFLHELRIGIAFWHGDGTATSPDVTSVENELTGVNARTGAGSATVMPNWGVTAAKPPSRPSAGSVPTAGRRESIKEWAATILCAALALGGAVIGNVTYGKVGMWTGEVIGLLLGVVIAWHWLRDPPRNH